MPIDQAAGTKKPAPINNAPVKNFPKPLPAPVITGLILKISLVPNGNAKSVILSSPISSVPTFTL